jgi:molecular chaperone GrpE
LRIEEQNSVKMAEENTPNEAMNEDTVGNEQTSQEETTVTDSDQTDNSAENSVPSVEEQMAAMNDKYLRLYSEFDNYRKRTNKEKLELIATASAAVLKELLSVLDDFDRAIANNEQVDDASALKEGFNLIHTKLKSTLEAKGLKQMVAKGEAFDPELHEAIANIPAPSDELKGKVVDDVERGYYLNEKVIRYAKVVVGN